MPQTRQLAAIMFTDIVGFTALMGSDETKTFELLNKNRQIHKPIIEQYNGRYIKELGDGVMASFTTVSDAVNAAIKIQEACNKAREFQLRIGIHVGEIVIEDGDIFGDAVNIASRVQTLAVPGSILISYGVQEEIKNKSEFQLASLGFFDFKHVTKPMEVFAVINEGLPKPARNSIKGKVKETNLPYKKWILIAALLVISLASFLFYKYNLSANLSQSGQNKNMTKNPVAYEWYTKAKYRLSPENKGDVDSCILFLQKAIAADSSFALAYADLSRAYSIKNYFIDPKGGYSEKAFIEAEKALYLNPNLAEGYFARAYCTWTFENRFPHEKVIREYKKAIALNPNLDEAYHWLCVVYSHVGLNDEAFEVGKQSIQSNPDNIFAKLDYGSTSYFLQTKAGWEQMVDNYRKMPDHHITPFRSWQPTLSLINLGRFNEAETILSTQLKKDSTNVLTNSTYAILLLKKGDKAGALKRIALCTEKNLSIGHAF